MKKTLALASPVKNHFGTHCCCRNTVLIHYFFFYFVAVTFFKTKYVVVCSGLFEVCFYVCNPLKACKTIKHLYAIFLTDVVAKW